MSIFHYKDIFTPVDKEYILSLPEVKESKAKTESTNRTTYFNIELTDSIKNTIQERFGLDLSNVQYIPMRWIKGDMPMHNDVGKHDFEYTYLVYLTESTGKLIINDLEYDIMPNEAFVFHEGLKHETIGTGQQSRLLLGPMNEYIEPVGAGAPLFYYPTEADALAYTNLLASSSTYTVGDISSGSIGAITSWRIASNSYGSSSQSVVYVNGNVLIADGAYFLYPAAPCFLEGTKILTLKNGVETYIPIEFLSRGDLVKTYSSGYKAVNLIGKGTILNPGGDLRNENRLYKCTPSRYPVLTEDLIITGDHSILVDNITNIQKEALIKTLGKIFVTDKKYRLTAQHDERTEPWGENKEYTIWHLALENSDEKMNYGIYANGGLLVETCSIYFLKNKSNMLLN